MAASSLPVQTSDPAFTAAELIAAVQRVREPVQVVRDPSGRVGLAFGPTDAEVLGALPALYPEWLGDRTFAEAHGVRFPYVCGAMANGIATTELVIEAARAGFLGFFGAAGLSPDRVSAAIDELQAALQPNEPWGSNLIHAPNEPAIEAAIADLYIRRQVRRVSASAYMSLTAPIVRYAYTGVRRGEDGKIRRSNHVFAKISRPEVARRFLEPAPAELLEALVARGELSADEARIAAELPVAEDITVESDSGGHTDNRPLGSLFGAIAAVRDEVSARRGYSRPIRVGAAGGLGTPTGVAPPNPLGAAYVVTGSVNQACVESGLHERGRELLAKADLTDVVMAPAADMFEAGVEVQVLKRGTMFGVRAKRLYDIYRDHPSLDDIPAATKGRLEDEILRASCADAWASTRAYWMQRDPREVESAERDPKHKMALVFRAYLGQSSRWAIAGAEDRRADYQIWCGPAMGAFNAWTGGTFLAEPSRRTIAQVGLNLMEGAAVVTRAQQLRTFGAPVPAAAFDFRPRSLR